MSSEPLCVCHRVRQLELANQQLKNKLAICVVVCTKREDCYCVNCKKKRHDSEIKLLEEKIKELEKKLDGELTIRRTNKYLLDSNEILRGLVNSRTDIVLADRMNKLELANQQLKNKLAIRADDEKRRSEYWMAAIKNCRKLMPKGSDGICLDTFIRSILDENKQLKEERADGVLLLDLLNFENRQLQNELAQWVDAMRKLKVKCEELEKKFW